MVCPKCLFINYQCPLEERLGLGVATLDLVKLRQIVETSGHAGVFRSQGIFVNRERSPVKGLGLGVAALGMVEFRQIIEGGGCVRMV